jgi:hypothetical protein
MQKMKRSRPLKEADIERELETMFGVPDGTDSEDGLEDSDSEANLEKILSVDAAAEATFPLEREFADSLLVSSVTKRRGKHGPEDANIGWEEHEESENTTDYDSENEACESTSTPVLTAKSRESAAPSAREPAMSSAGKNESALASLTATSREPVVLSAPENLCPPIQIHSQLLKVLHY